MTKEFFEKLIQLSNIKDGKVSSFDERKVQLLGKVSEEVGEFSKALVQPERCTEDFVQEGADAITAIIDAMLVFNTANGVDKKVTYISLVSALYNAVDKWEEKYNLSIDNDSE